MPEIKKIKPALAGISVRKPDGKHLRSDGESVEITSYWQRRIDSGEVIEVTKTEKLTSVEGKK